MTVPESLDLTKTLIEFESVSRDSNLPLIEFVENYLDDHGVKSFRVENEDKTKANLVASVGPEEAGGVVLSGHTDVVPVDGQPWNYDPFDATINGDKLYGRGTCDMKAFIGSALNAISSMGKLKKPIHFALSYDEEVGCKGAPDMIEQIQLRLPEPAAVIVGEPTSMGSVSAHKGIVLLKTVVTGFETHSSQTQRGVSAVTTAAQLVSYLDVMANSLRNSALEETGFEPNYTSIHVGVIKGGTAVNIVSRHCEFVWDIRTVPGDDAQQIIDQFEGFCQREILPEMRRRFAGAGISSTIFANAPPFEVLTDSPAMELVQRLTGLTSVSKVSYAAEAGLYQLAGLPCVICGPGSIDQAHQPDEYIEIDQIEASDQFMRKLVEKFS
ncbi:MAG: acetylornithine deacetylase [Parasphingorhabdus sp.]|jgi:acetylornithine deacetylase